MKKFGGVRSLLLFLIISYFLFWELSTLRLPAVQTDEAWMAVFSFRALKDIPQPGNPSDRYINLFGRWLPLLSTPYHGIGEIYLLMPFILLGGLNILSIRIFSLFVGLSILIILYLFNKEILNESVAFIVVFLLTIDWAFLTGIKLSLQNGSIIEAFPIATLLLFYKWFKSKRKLYFCIGSFLLGMGLFIRTWFLWYLFALIAVVIVFLRSLFSKFARKEIIVCLILGTLSFFIAISPLIYHQTKTHFEMLKYLLNHFPQTRCGINNLQYLRNFNSRLDNFIELPLFHFKQDLLREGAGGNNNEIYKRIINNLGRFYFFIFGICLVWHFVTAFILKKKNFLNQKRLMAILFCAMFVQTPFTLSFFAPEHLLILLPIVKIMLGMFIFEIMSFSKKAKAVVISGLIILFVVHNYGLVHYTSALKKTGGVGISSDAIYRVANYLSSKGVRNVVLMDYTMNFLIYLISGGKINEIFHDFNDGANKLEGNESYQIKFKTYFDQQIGQELENRDNVYLFHSPEVSFIKCLDLFQQLAQKKNRQSKEMERFYQRDGRWVYSVYNVY